MRIISKENFAEFVTSLINDDALEVMGVKSKGDKFAFGPLESANELRLDYDVTLLPPKKYFFPQRETLFTYDLTKGFSAKASIANGKPTVIVGVHPYDIAALLQMDKIFAETKSDPYYAEKRKASIIIGVNIQNMSEWCFAPSMGHALVDSGYDLMLTDIGDKYAIDIGSEKGKELLEKYAKNVSNALAPDIQLVEQKKSEILNMAQQKLNFQTELIPNLLSKSYEQNEFWETHSEQCLGCGSCVLVCPTCYCFDVKDNPDLSLEHGERIRTWDGCLLEDFAKIASGENFRPTKQTRYRHRYFKKGKYLYGRFGFISCVGCGRCSSNCLPDIANPVSLFNDLHEQLDEKEPITAATVPETKIETKEKIDFVPRIATIVKKTPMTANEILFEIKLNDGSELGHEPGQFAEISVFGVGEAPISLSSPPTKKGTFELCVRKVGNVTGKLHTLNVGDTVGVRGPFGKGFDANFLKGKDLLFIAGGLGIAPLRSLFNYVLDNRKDYGRVILLYGCKEPSELLFSDEIFALVNRDDVEFLPTVDSCPEGEEWSDNIGVITTLIPKIDFDPEKTWAVVCGPPIMYKFVISDLKKRKMPDDHMLLSLERRMKCGVGKCGHCQINQIYVCKDGPVFNYSKIKGVPEAL